MINLIQGEDKTIQVTLSKASGYVDLTSATEITVKIPTKSGTPITKLKTTAAITVTSPTTGTFIFTLDDTETATLKVEDGQNWEITVDIGSNRKIYQVTDNLSVKAKIF